MDLQETIASATGATERKVVLDEDFSFILVPSASERQSELPGTPILTGNAHNLVNIGKAGKVLIIPDYAPSLNDAGRDEPTTLISVANEQTAAPAPVPATHQSSGSSNKNTQISQAQSLNDQATGEASASPIKSQSSHQTNSSSTATSSSPAPSSAAPSSHSETNKSKDSRSLSDIALQITLESKLADISVLHPTTLEILDTQANVTLVSQLLEIKTKNAFLYSFLKESGLCTNLDDVLDKLSKAVAPSAPAKPADQAEKKPIQTSQSAKSIQSSQSAKPAEMTPFQTKPAEPLNLREKNEVAGFPISVIDDLASEDKCQFITKHAYIYTVGELAEFPQTFPGIYMMLKESGLMNNIDDYIARARELINLGETIVEQTAVPKPAAAQPLSLDSSWLSPQLSDSASHKKKMLLLLKQPFWNAHASVDADTSVFALAGLDERDVEILAGNPLRPVRNLKELAQVDQLPELRKLLQQQVPLLDEFILHARALVTK